MYGSSPNPRRGGGGSGANEISRFLFRSGAPFTLTLILLNIVTFFLFYAFPGGVVANALAFQTQKWPVLFWTLLTWPVTAVREDPLGLVFSAGWAYTFAGSLERAWGTRVFGTFLLAVSALTALTVWLGSFLVGPGVLGGLWVAAGPATVAWCVVNSRDSINLFFVPLPAPVIGALGAAIVWFYAGAANGNPLLGLFALSGCAAAYWYARNGRYLNRGYSTVRRGGAAPQNPLRFQNFDRETVTPPRPGFNLLRWWRVRQESKRLEQFMKRSGFTAPDDKDRP